MYPDGIRQFCSAGGSKARKSGISVGSGRGAGVLGMGGLDKEAREKRRRRRATGRE